MQSWTQQYKNIFEILKDLLYRLFSIRLQTQLLTTENLKRERDRFSCSISRSIFISFRFRHLKSIWDLCVVVAPQISSQHSSIKVCVRLLQHTFGTITYTLIIDDRLVFIANRDSVRLRVRLNQTIPSVCTLHSLSVNGNRLLCHYSLSGRPTHSISTHLIGRENDYRRQTNIFRWKYIPNVRIFFAHLYYIFVDCSFGEFALFFRFAWNCVIS